MGMKKNIKDIFQTIKFLPASNKIENCVQKGSLVNFLCYGNICRSAFAERYFESEASKSENKIEVISSGFHEKENRESPEAAQEAAGKFSVDLSAHRSRKISGDLVNKSSVIIGMHYSHYSRFKEQFPDHVRKFYLLKQFDPSFKKIINIHDPYGKSVETFIKCFAEIKTCVDWIIR